MGEVRITRRPDPHAELGYECPECKAWSPVSMRKETRSAARTAVTTVPGSARCARSASTRSSPSSRSLPTS